MRSFFLGSGKPIFADFALLLLRIFFGGLMAINHGWSKLMKWDELKNDFMNFLGMGDTISAGLCIFAELFCAVLIALGLFTRLAAIPLIVTMGVAAFDIHWADPLSKKEFSLLYLAAYVAILLLGAGRYSLDALLLKKK